MSHRRVGLPCLVILGVLVSALRGQVTTEFQTGGAQGRTDTPSRSCFTRVTSYAYGVNAWTTESTELLVDQTLAIPLVDFPDIIGTRLNQIPPGATILSATLRLYCTQLNGAPWGQTTLTASAITDIERRGSWYEPPSSISEGQQVGANWLRRDGRPDRDIPWSTSSTLPSTTAQPPYNVPLLNPVVVVDLTSSPTPGSVSTTGWHAWNVTSHVTLWAQGFPNQGWLIDVLGGHELTYASDDATNASQRPRLEVVWMPAATPPINRLPVLSPTIPANVSTTRGLSVPIILSATDPDGPVPELRIIEPPLHGTLSGEPPFLVYHPNPEYVGQDSFRWTAVDGFGHAYPQTVPITIAAGATLGVVLQEGVAPTGALSVGSTRMCGTRESTQAGGQSTFEDTTLKVIAGSRTVFLDFPSLIGSGPGQIPLGSTVLDAKLTLSFSYNEASSVQRVVTLYRLVDPYARGTSFAEPSFSAPESTGCSGCGVTWLYPDAAQPGFVFGTPGGDVSSLDQATLAVTPSDPSAVSKTADVTQALRAWASGEPNHGWTLRSSSTTLMTLWADDAPDPSLRPRLAVSFVPPSASLPTANSVQVDAGGDQSVFAHQTVTLDGDGSFLSGAGTPSFLWLQTGGPAVSLVGATSTRPQFVAPVTTQPLTLEFTLIGAVGGIYGFDVVNVFVTPQPGGTSYTSPLSDAGTASTVTELSPVTLLGTAQATSGGVLAMRWTKVFGPHVTLLNEASLTPNFIAPAVNSGGATLIFDLAVTETVGSFVSTAHDQVTVTVTNAVNTAPVANAGPDRLMEENTWGLLDASASFDPEGQTLLFTWQQLSGPTVGIDTYQAQGVSSARTVPFRAPAVSALTPLVFRVTASDGELQHTDLITVTIEPSLPSFTGSLTNSPMTPYREELTALEARHLLRRIGDGIPPARVTAVRAAGLTPTVNTALALGTLTDPTVRDEALHYAEDIASPGNANPPLLQPFDLMPQYNGVQLEAYWVVHALRSQNVLLERLVRFWHDRLAASVRYLNTGKRHWSVPHGDMLRDHALGNYRDLLLAFARDPVTLGFIDGFDNLAVAPNENFAREFMELHTLGVFDPSGARIYTQNDVTDAARAFTGYRPSCFTLTTGLTQSCYPAFVPFFHDSGMKTVLGMSGNFDDAGLVDVVLAADGGNAAARWLAKGLLEWFVVPEPPASCVNAFAAVILQNNWELSPSLATLLRSRAMFAPEARKALVRSPIDLANQVVRTLGMSMQTTDLASPGSLGLVGQLGLLDQRLGSPADVDGWPTGLRWIDDFSVVRRFELMHRLIRVARTPTPATALDYPGIPESGLPFDDFLPPMRTRFGSETVDFVCDLLDVDLKTAPAQNSERDLVISYLNTRAATSTGPLGYTAIAEPFDANVLGFEDKLFGLLLLLLEHPEASRM